MFLDIALRNAARGFRVFPLIPKAKQPVKMLNGDHFDAATVDREQIEQWAQQEPNANCGMSPDENFCVLESDSFAKLRSLCADLPTEIFDTFTVSARPDRVHLYYRQTQRTRAAGNVTLEGCKGEPNVFEFKQFRVFVVAEGSIHPKTGKPYEVICDGIIPAMPDVLLNRLKELKGISSEPTNPRPDDEVQKKLDWLAGLLEHYKVAVVRGPRTSAQKWLIDVLCPWLCEHTEDSNVSQTSVMFTPGTGYGFCCQHGHCANRDWKAFRKELERLNPTLPRYGRQLPYIAHGPLAESFAEQTEDFAFLYDRGTYAAYVQSRWSIGDRHGLLLRKAVNQFLSRLFDQFPEPEDSKKDPRKLLFDSRFRQGVVEQVQPLLPFWKFAEKFDRDPLLLGVPGNCVVDLRTGKLRGMLREDYVTHKTNVLPDARCEPTRFLKFLDEITAGDKDLSGYLMRYGGYVLTGYTHEHCIPFWYGCGANGKGVLINVWQHIMGTDYGKALRVSDLARRAGANENERRIIAKLCGARLATANEGNASVKLDMALLKLLASSDLLTGAFLYENEFQFYPTHKLIIATNAKPELEVDDAARRRVHLVPFDVSFRGREDRYLEQHLKNNEAGGILHLMIQACLEWQRIGLAPPRRVTEATEQLFSDLDPVGRFVTECTEAAPGEFLATDDLTTAFAYFLQESDYNESVDPKRLVHRLVELGAKRCRKRLDSGVNARGFVGLRLKGIVSAPCTT